LNQKGDFSPLCNFQVFVFVLSDNLTKKRRKNISYCCCRNWRNNFDMNFGLKHQILVLALNTAHEYVIVSSKKIAKSSLLWKQTKEKL